MDEIPFVCEHQDKKKLYFKSGKACWHEGIICLETDRSSIHMCNYAMVCMRYMSDPKGDGTNIIINYGEEDISYDSLVLPAHKKVSVGSEMEYVETIEEFFAEYVSNNQLPTGTMLA